MAEQKTSRKVLRTQRLIRKILAELLESKELKDITVQEIADMANFSRTTFYNYYKNVYDIYHQIERELFEKMCIEIWLERANKSELTEMQSFLIHHHVQGSLAIVARWARNDYKNPKELIVNAMSIADQAAEDFIMKE